MLLITTSIMCIQGLARDLGTVNSVKIFEDANNGKSKGAAEIEFAEPAAAAKCKAALHGCASGPSGCMNRRIRMRGCSRIARQSS